MLNNDAIVRCFGFDYKWGARQNPPLDLKCKFILEKRSVFGDEVLNNADGYVDIPLKIRKVNKDLISVPMKGAEVESLNRWLFQDSRDEELELDGLYYKGTFRKANLFWSRNASKDGYVNVVFRMINLAYCLPCVIQRIENNEEDIFEIRNNTNAVDLLDTIIGVEILKYKNITTNNFTIENLTNGNKVSINVNADDKEFNIDSIKLNKGANQIKITTDGHIRVLIEFRPVFINVSEVLQCPSQY